MTGKVRYDGLWTIYFARNEKFVTCPGLFVNRLERGPLPLRRAYTPNMSDSLAWTVTKLGMDVMNGILHFLLNVDPLHPHYVHGFVGSDVRIECVHSEHSSLRINAECASGELF